MQEKGSASRGAGGSIGKRDHIVTVLSLLHLTLSSHVPGTFKASSQV